MKNLLNCHTVGLHSFPISYQEGLYKRIFYADTNHHLWKPIELAIHPHHVDIKITVLEGELFNPLYEIDESGDLYKKFQWASHIINGNGGFEYKGYERLKMVSNEKLSEGQSTIMKSCELHTVQVERYKKCVWLIEERVPSCDYFPMNYSLENLENWSTKGLYIEVDNDVKQKYIGKYLNKIKI